MSFMELVKPELLILVPFLYGVGYLTSKLPKIKDWMVNIVLAVISITVTIGYMFAFMPEGKAIQTAISALLQGTIIAMATITSEKAIELILEKKLPPSSGGDKPAVDGEEEGSEDYIDEIIEIDEDNDKSNK